MSKDKEISRTKEDDMKRNRVYGPNSKYPAKKKNGKLKDKPKKDDSYNSVISY